MMELAFLLCAMLLAPALLWLATSVRDKEKKGTFFPTVCLAVLFGALAYLWMVLSG